MILKISNPFKIDFGSVRYVQYTAALIATLPAASVSMYFSWTSPSIPKIKEGNSPLPKDITETEIALIVGSLLLGCIPGIFLTGWTLSRFGRKTTLMFGALPLVLPWLVIAFANSAIMVAAARFVAGFGIPISVVPVMVYTCEIADKDIRGGLALTMKILAVSGSLYVLIVGPHLSYLVLTLTCGIVPVAFFFGIFYMPESPYYLVRIGKEDQAERNLTALMSKNTDKGTIKKQMDEIKSTIKKETATKGTLREIFTQKGHRRALILGLGLVSLGQLSGAVVLSAYMQTIFALSASAISPKTSSMIIGFLELFAVILSSRIVDKVGRKPLLIVSALGCAVGLFSEGLYFWLKQVMELDLTSVYWLPTAALGLNYIMRSFGVGTVPFIVIGEIFSTNIQAMASMVLGLFSVVITFMSSMSFGPVTAKYGVYVMFWIYTAICLLGALFVFFLVPETKGKTFSEIRDQLHEPAPEPEPQKDCSKC